jgi:MarR family transcriptional repressor of emrRAB
MRGREKLTHLDSCTPGMAQALPDLPMDKTIMVRLLRIGFFGMASYFEQVFRDADISENGFHVLCLLAATESGSESPTELAEMVGTSRSNTTRLLNELAASGYVERTAGCRDARRQLVTILPTGREKVDETVLRVSEPLENAFSDLSKNELAQLDLLLRKMIVSFDKSARALRIVA